MSARNSITTAVCQTMSRNIYRWFCFSQSDCPGGIGISYACLLAPSLPTWLQWEIDRAGRAIITAGLFVFAYFYLVLPLVKSWGPVSPRESHDNARRLAANPGERQGGTYTVGHGLSRASWRFLLRCESCADGHFVF